MDTERNKFLQLLKCKIVLLSDKSTPKSKIMKTQQAATLQPELGRRLGVAREAAGLTQAQLSAALGFNDRQTLQAIEAGHRGVSADELVALIDATGKDLEFFTDPFRLVDEGRFSFRAHGASDAGLLEFEETAGSWVAFWREEGKRQKTQTSPIRPRLDLHENSTYADAQAAGEALWENWNLGDVPADRLVEVAENQLSLLVLHVDMPKGISGAACQASGSDTVLVNRLEPEGRRHFDLAHEIFHVLTWDALPPRRVDRENPSGYKDKHIERLADNFAGALLMPLALLEPSWKARPEQISLAEWITGIASRLQVSGQAVKWRLANLGFISTSDLKRLRQDSLISQEGASPPAAFSRAFMERAARAIERGHVSVMRLARLLETTGTGGLEQLFLAHGLTIPFNI
jgi:Zn-dependent peptidase ImmA (M78 family)/transcriptional regulator with XRE-family HTH domain